MNTPEACPSTHATPASILPHAHDRIAWFISVSGVALLGVTLGITKYISPHYHGDSMENAVAARLEEAMQALSNNEEVDIEELEEQISRDIGDLKNQLAQRIPTCCDECGNSDSYILASVFCDKPLSAEKLHSASSRLSLPVQNHIQCIAKVLVKCPELGPNILTMLHDHLGRCSDRRAMLCYIIPKTDHDLSDAKFVRSFAIDFLRLQETNMASRSQENSFASSE